MKYDKDQILQINNSISIVEYASQYLELHKRNNEYWSMCCFHSDDVNPSLSFNEEKNSYYCFGCGSKGYLINFIMQYHKLSFPKAIELILKLTKIDLQEREYSETLDFLYKSNLNKYEKEVLQRTYLNENEINQYIKEPIKEWLSEGIKQEILDKYNVRYDLKGNAIVFPIRDIDGQIISIKARTLFKNYKNLGIPKYIYYYPIGTNNFLFGLYENINNIKSKKEVIVLEGAKGVMLAESYRYDNCVSLETNRINDLQMDILLQLKVDIVMALDKGIKIISGKKINDKNNINIGLLPKLTNVYIIEDRHKLLQDKDCPADRGKEVFDKLYEDKYKI